jgi:hypothetical protein
VLCSCQATLGDYIGRVAINNANLEPERSQEVSCKVAHDAAAGNDAGIFEHVNVLVRGRLAEASW